MSSGPGTAYVLIKGSNFADSRIKGNGDECYLFGDASANGHVFVAADDPFTSGACDVRHCDRIGLQLITENDAPVSIVPGAASGVVSGTKTFTFPNYTFTGLVGYTVTISGDVVNPGNNGDFVITSSASAHTFVASAASGLTTETFASDIVVSIQAPALTGDWTVEVSNNYTPVSTGTAYGQVQGEAGKWSDITAGFSPAIDNASDNQFVQLDIAARSLRVTFTPTA